MTKNSQLTEATRAAENLLKEKGQVRLPIDPFAIAKSLEITVTAKPNAMRGVSGMLVRNGNEFGIFYATHVPSPGFQRFSVAHEIGHFVLPGHIDYVFRDGDIHKSQAGFLSKDCYEREADYFAAGLLMPEPMFSQEMGECSDGLSAIKFLSQRCEASLTATAIRYIERTVAPAAIVISQGGIIEYCRMSKTLQEFRGLSWLRKNTPLPTSVETYRFNLDSRNIADCEEWSNTTDLRDWFDGEREREAYEEIIGLGAYGKTMTVISLENFADEEDEDEYPLEPWRD